MGLNYLSIHKLHRCSRWSLGINKCFHPTLEHVLTHPRWDHGDVIKWKHFPRYWPFVRGIHRSPANSPHMGQWRGALIFSLICVWITGWVNNREAGDLRRYRSHYDVSVMSIWGGSIVVIISFPAPHGAAPTQSTMLIMEPIFFPEVPSADKYLSIASMVRLYGTTRPWMISSHFRCKSSINLRLFANAKPTFHSYLAP